MKNLTTILKTAAVVAAAGAAGGVLDNPQVIFQPELLGKTAVIAGATAGFGYLMKSPLGAGLRPFIEAALKPSRKKKPSR